MKEINVAIIGCGFVSNMHLEVWRRIPYARVLGICDTNREALENTARNWKISSKFTSVSALKNCREIDLWDICTPPQTHSLIAVQALRAGFDVLIEKPLAMTTKDAEKIIACQRTTNKKVGIIHNWLFEPPVIKARTLVEQGKIGKIRNAQVDILHPKNEEMAANELHWVHKLPGGRLSENLAHPIYLLRHFLGDIKLENVAVSKTGDYPWMKYDELHATFRAGEKFGGTYQSFNSPRYAIFINLFGEEGIIKLDVINATLNVLPRLQTNRFNKGIDSIRQAYQLVRSTVDNASKILSGRWYSGHEMYMRLFAERLTKNGELPVTIQEGYEVVKVLEDVCTRIR